MTLPLPFPADCRLVVFDLDGTLYRQSKLRRAMLLALLTEGGPGRLRRMRDLAAFRKIREEFSDSGAADFDAMLFQRTAAATGRPEGELRRLVAHWMEERPLPLLRAARTPGAEELFASLRRRGVQIAVWSDYPVAAKLAALGLTADLTLAATDPELGRLKPDPTGLAMLLERAGCPPSAALMVGDRVERDGKAAERLGVPFLLRSRKGPPGISRVDDFRGLAASLR